MREILRVETAKTAAGHIARIRKEMFFMMSSLYIGATGLKSHGEGLSVVTNNLANVNTVGFKQHSMQYMDMVSQFVAADSNALTNMSQLGAGSSTGSVRTLFTAGGVEKGSEATDLCIDGGGFFGVTKNGQTHYTRAGNFRFTKTGELLDPTGWNVLGHAITNGVEASATTPIVLDSSSTGVSFMPAKATTNVVSCSMLGGLEEKNRSADNPFFRMTASWDGTASTPLAEGDYGYSEPFEFYDSNGELRQAAIYYDLAGKSGGNTAVEYLVAFDPAMDASGRAGTEAAGLLMAGTITFDSTGEMINLTAFTPPDSGSPADLSGWNPASLSAAGYPAFTVHPAGNDESPAVAQDIALNMGLSLSGTSSAGLASAADAAGDAETIYSAGESVTLNSTASVNFGESCAGIVSKKDGYSEGMLTEVTVGEDGVITGRYTNGETNDLYRINLYRFVSQDGLINEGSNHYSATEESGEAQEGVAGTKNFGTMAQYALEGSNVDYAREFSLMIVTQRGFQMNSKVVTTSDEMLRKALEIKR